MAIDCRQFFINGEWLAMAGRPELQVINPATEQVCATLCLGTAADVDLAVRAARTAFPAWSQSGAIQRLEILDRIIAGIMERTEELAQAVSTEMGAPISFARTAHVGTGLAHFVTARQILADYEFEKSRGNTRIQREPIGVCGFITPWNWPLNQVTCKLAPALATGCTMVLKPSELAPLSAGILVQIIAAAGVPAGVFNMVHGDGPTVGAAIAAHPQIDLVSFTGSTRAGREVVQDAKWCRTRSGARRCRLHQESDPGAGRQVGQHHSRGGRFPARRNDRGVQLFQQCGAVLQCTDTHAGAPGTP